MQQAVDSHPLHDLGYHRPPHWLWRLSRRAYVVMAAISDIRLIVTGRCSLHRAWQAGHDHGTKMEYQRTVVNGGR